MDRHRAIVPLRDNSRGVAIANTMKRKALSIARPRPIEPNCPIARAIDHSP